MCDMKLLVINNSTRPVNLVSRILQGSRNAQDRDCEYHRIQSENLMINLWSRIGVHNFCEFTIINLNSRMHIMYMLMGLMLTVK